VQRQYSGTAGRIENCQIGVFLGYTSRHGQALIDRALYLPAVWAKDEDRRREARIPTEIAFTTKPKLGLAMLERARQNGVPFAWITGDSVYGADHAIRRWAERHRRGYVLAVTSKQYLGQRLVTSWIKRLPRKAWQRLSAGDGAKGPRLYDWGYIPQRSRAWLPVRPAGASLDRQTNRADILSDPRAERHLTGQAGADRRPALAYREPVRTGQRRGRPGSVRSPLLGRLAPPYHPLDVRSRLSRRRPKGRYRGVWSR
jgi:hypothetical protein